MLGSRRKARFCRYPLHMDHNGLFGIARALVSADTYRKIQIYFAVVTARRINGTYSEFLEGLPVTDNHVCIYERHLDGEGESGLLGVGQFHADIGDHYMPAG